MPLPAKVARPVPATWFMKSCGGAYDTLRASFHPLAESLPIFVKEIIFGLLPRGCIKSA